MLSKVAWQQCMWCNYCACDKCGRAYIATNRCKAILGPASCVLHARLAGKKVITIMYVYTDLVYWLTQPPIQYHCSHWLLVQTCHWWVDHVTAHAYTYFSLLIPGVTAGLSFEDFTGVLLSFIRGAMGSVVGGAGDLCVSVCCREGECEVSRGAISVWWSR